MTAAESNQASAHLEMPTLVDLPSWVSGRVEVDLVGLPHLILLNAIPNQPPHHAETQATRHNLFSKE